MTYHVGYIRNSKPRSIGNDWPTDIQSCTRKRMVTFLLMISVFRDSAFSSAVSQFCYNNPIRETTVSNAPQFISSPIRFLESLIKTSFESSLRGQRVVFFRISQRLTFYSLSSIVKTTFSFVYCSTYFLCRKSRKCHLFATVTSIIL
jgi:hypothetical protein